MDDYQLTGKVEIKDNLKMIIRHNLKMLIAMTIVLIAAFVSSLLVRQYLWAALLLLYFVVVGGVFYYQARKSYTSSPTLQTEQHYWVSKHEIRSEFGLSESRIEKQAIIRIKYFNDAIYIYLSQRGAFILEKSWLKNGNWEDFIHYMKANYPNKK